MPIPEPCRYAAFPPLTSASALLPSWGLFFGWRREPGEVGAEGFRHTANTYPSWWSAAHLEPSGTSSAASSRRQDEVSDPHDEERAFPAALRLSGARVSGRCTASPGQP